MDCWLQGIGVAAVSLFSSGDVCRNSGLHGMFNPKLAEAGPIWASGRGKKIIIKGMAFLNRYERTCRMPFFILISMLLSV